MKRLTVVSNRLPVVLRRDASGDWRLSSGAGGLVTALAPVLQHRGGRWIGWPGVDAESFSACEHLIPEGSKASGYELIPIALGREEIRHYYEGFSNGILWPLFHDLVSQCDFNPRHWPYYLKVNERFAEKVCDHSGPDDFIWVHDYHLIHVAEFIRRRAIDRKTGFFLHIPFPPLDIFIKLPWRAQILRALLAYDLIGFQTGRDRRNFINCVRQLIPDVRTSGKGHLMHVDLGDRTVKVGSFPIGLDAKGLRQAVESHEVRRHVAEYRGHFSGMTVVLGVDRLDYTKGLPERLYAFRNALDRYPELRGKTVMVLVVAPSRETAPGYAELKAKIERLVGSINGTYSQPGWVPVHYHYQQFRREELIALYRIADIAFVTPLKDGMNLVAKEYCVCQKGGQGVLILSEFAGAAAQLHRGALLVNPHDVEGMADAIRRAIEMGAEEKRQRMQRLRGVILRRDIFWWVNRYLDAAVGTSLQDYSQMDEYLPHIDIKDQRP